MNSKQDRRRKWTTEQEQTIKKLYPKIGATKLAVQMGVTKDSLKCKARALEVRDAKFVEWTPEIEKEIRKCYQMDGPVELAKRLGITLYALVAKAKRMGVGATRKRPPKDFEWTEEMLTMLKERYVVEGGLVLAKELGLAISAVRRKASSLGLHTNAGHKQWGEIKSAANISLDIHYFDKWSPNMAYILGFFFADGSINKRQTSMVVNQIEKNKSILDFICSELQVQRELTYYPEEITKGGMHQQPRYTLHLNSKMLVARLMKLGIHPRKTFNDDPFPNVPDEYMPHFVRGVLDGDGCASIGANGVLNISIVGSVKFIQGLEEAVSRLAGTSRRLVRITQGKTAVYATVWWGSVADVPKFYHFVYPEGFTFCLERKRANIVKWMAEHKRGAGHYFGNGTQTKEELETEWKPWTQEERDFIIANPTDMPLADMARKLGRSKNAVAGQMKRLKRLGLLVVEQPNLLHKEEEKIQCQQI